MQRKIKMKSVIECIRAFLLECPLLAGGTMHVNFLEHEPVQFTIDEVPTEPIVKRYADGSTVRQTLFVLASSEFYSRNELENLKTCGFYEQLADWIETQDAADHLPALENAEARKIEVLTNGYCIAADIEQNVQRYQIQCRLTYFKEAR